MKISKIKKYIFSTFFVGISLVSSLVLTSCSGAAFTQNNTKINLTITGTNSYFQGKRYSFLPNPQSPTFYDSQNNTLDLSKDKLFAQYWSYLIGPIYSISMPALSLDSATKNSFNLSNSAQSSNSRNPSFNYAISNSWISGSNIYNGSSYRFKTLPYEMNATINGTIPDAPKDGDTISQVKNTITMSGISFKLSYFDINNGNQYDKLKAQNELNNFFQISSIMQEYVVSLNLFCELDYEVVNIEDDKPIAPNIKFDSKKMKVKVTPKFYIGNSNSGFKFEPEQALSNFNNWINDTNSIEPAYKNFISSIQ